jgi:hypothetical protein
LAQFTTQGKAGNIRNIKIVWYFCYYSLPFAVMDIDDSAILARGPMLDESAAAAAAVEAMSRSLVEGAERRASLIPASNSSTCSISSEKKVMHSFTPSDVFKQCSNAKQAEKTVNVYSTSGTGIVSEPATVPRIRQMYWESENEMCITFHGARIMKGGKLVNECLTASFDPATLHCITCKDRHSIFGPRSRSGYPTSFIFSDQNFPPSLGGGTGSNCVAVARLEDAKLGDLTNLILEIFEKSGPHPGSVLLIGSASHLFHEGVTSYASGWLCTLSRLNAKLKNVNICPLVPVLRDDCPGILVRDIELLSF